MLPTEERLAFLEERFAEWQRLYLINAKQDHAGQLALFSMVAEMAEQLGLSHSEVHRHYKTRRAWMLDRLLRKVESKDPSVAADIDERKIGDVPTSGGYPPLFPPTSPQ
jgi:hypothetical protein